MGDTPKQHPAPISHWPSWSRWRDGAGWVQREMLPHYPSHPETQPPCDPFLSHPLCTGFDVRRAPERLPWRHISLYPFLSPPSPSRSSGRSTMVQPASCSTMVVRWWAGGEWISISKPRFRPPLLFFLSSSSFLFFVFSYPPPLLSSIWTSSVRPQRCSAQCFSSGCFEKDWHWDWDRHQLARNGKAVLLWMRCLDPSCQEGGVMNIDWKERLMKSTSDEWCLDREWTAIWLKKTTPSW